jgi:G:T-mismatch repair DNA endonuclease (very short patch repair protein)
LFQVKKMKPVTIPTIILSDLEISYEAKGVYWYLYAYNTEQMPSLSCQKHIKKLNRCIKELIKNKYIKIEKNTVFFIR